MMESRRISAIADDRRAFRSAGQFGLARRSPLSRAAQIHIKHAADRILALAGLIILSPALLICGVIIRRISPGPALFLQARTGFEGRTFQILKLRTMHPHKFGDMPSDHDASRIFWFGALLRRFSIDELPQLINVLKGEMSLVGPRPHMIGQRVEGRLFEDAVSHYARRHKVLPGMTGLAQINGCRGPAASQAQIARRVALDLQYVDGWSLTLDLRIIARTICLGFLGTPAC